MVADDSGDGPLAFLEFVTLMGKENKTNIKPNPYIVLEQLRLQIREFREVFEIFDPDDSGDIACDEVMDAMQNLILNLPLPLTLTPNPNLNPNPNR